jgi:hypothetical protein
MDPRKVAKYRDEAGLPDENTGRYLSIGKLHDTTGVKVKAADPLDGNRGGRDEIEVPNVGKQISIEATVPMVPPL